MRTPLLLGSALAALLLATSAAAVSPRTHVVVHGPEVRLSDLFEGALPRGDRVLGPAPAPGRLYTVEAGQLAAIARANGITLAAPSTAVVERPGRPLAREAVEQALREALVSAGAIADPDAALVLQGFTAPVVPLGITPPRIVVEDLGWDSAQGRFNAQIAAIVGPEAPVRARIAGRVDDTVAVPVAVRRLAEGDVIRPGDLRVVRLPAARVPEDAVLDAARLSGRTLRHAVAAGAPVTGEQFGAAAEVQRGAAVSLVVALPGIEIAAQGRALEDGARGARIQVMNSASRAVLEGVVVGPGRVRVSADSAPLSTPQRNGREPIRTTQARRAEPAR